MTPYQAEYQKNGMIHLKSVFSFEEVCSIRAKIFDIQKEAEIKKLTVREDDLPDTMAVLGDLLSKPQLEPFDYLMFNQQVLYCLHEILGPEIIYFGESVIQVGKGSRGYHKDNVTTDEKKWEWSEDSKEKYDVVKAIFCLQNCKKYSGGTKIRLGSHRFPNYSHGKAVNPEMEAGDVIIFNQRITHSGNFIRLRSAPNLVLSPRLERKIPNFLALPQESLPRILIVATFSKPGQAATRYEKLLVNRPDSLLHWKHSAKSETFEKQALALGVRIRYSVPEYGSLWRK